MHRRLSLILVVTAVSIAFSPDLGAQEGSETSEAQTSDTNASDTIGKDALQAIAKSTSGYLRMESANIEAGSSFSQAQIASQFPRSVISKDAIDCFEKLDDSDESDKPKHVAFVLSVDKSGNVTEVTQSKIETTVAEAKCIARDLEHVTFPASNGSSRATIIFEYDPRDREQVEMDSVFEGEMDDPHSPDKCCDEVDEADLPDGIGHLGRHDPPPESVTSQKPPSGEMTLGETRQAGMGSVEDKYIRMVFEKHNRKLLRCYERILKQDDANSGKVILTFVIQKDGRVRNVRVARDDLADAGLGQCIEKLVSRLTFRKPKGGRVNVRQVFDFARKTQGQDEQ